MPSIELLMEVELMRKDLARMTARAERAEHMAVLWKRCAKKKLHKAKFWKRACDSTEAERDNLATQAVINAVVLAGAEAELAALKKDAETWKTCAEGLKESLDITTAELSALKKDARELAEYVSDENTSRVGDNTSNADRLREAAYRILAATEG